MCGQSDQGGQDARYLEAHAHLPEFVGDYFYEMDRDQNRSLVLWGAGQNGKDMARLLQAKGDTFHWICDNENKIGNYYTVVLIFTTL